MRDTERAMKAMQEYIDNLGDLVNDDNIEEYTQQFIREYNRKIVLQRQGLLEYSDEEKAYNLYEQSHETNNPTQAKKLLKQALQLKPDFLDAKRELINYINDIFKRLKELELLEKEEKERLIKEGYFKEDEIGHFYGILETRPYIRLLYVIAYQYQMMGAYRKAMFLYENIIHLNEHDNVGARYPLMGIYASLEEKEKMDQLIEKYPEDSISEHLFQFVLAYKLLDYKNARNHLKTIQKRVPEFKKMIKGQFDEDDMIFDSPQGYYNPYLEEILMYMSQFDHLFMNDELTNFMIKTLR